MRSSPTFAPISALASGALQRWIVAGSVNAAHTAAGGASRSIARRKTRSPLGVTLDVFATSGEWVIAYGTFAVTVRSTGKKVSFPLAEVTHVVDGKIKLINPVYGDTAAILAALN